MQLLEVLALSASNLPNVRRLSTGKTRALVVLEGPLTEPYCTEEDVRGGLNPTWETPFTVSLNSKVRLKLTVLIKRRARKNKPIATAEVSLRDFASPGGGSHEYALVLCGAHKGDQPAILRMSARFFGGGRSHRRPKTPPAPVPVSSDYSCRNKGSNSDATGDESDADEESTDS